LDSGWTTEIDHSEKVLSPPTIEELVAVKPKAGRPKVLNKLEWNPIFAACAASKEAWRKQQHHVALETWICRMAVVNQLVTEPEGGNEFHA
jgi:hypothetical protein